ncbi:MAG TPA: polyprenyl synthetase family protein [Streptomyces sp.]|jgi:geranylgeranyl diphosphate synthase type I|nr:polyprenyl synthetase family protein [Streptomyces sp.]
MLDAQEYPDPLAPPQPRLPGPPLYESPSGSGRPRLAESRTCAQDNLEGWLSARSADPLAEQHRWALVPPGKLLRPALLLESAQALGGDPEQAGPVATGFELIHAGSLIHDDIIDGDEERRGRAAAHSRFGVDRAIVAADALFFAVFQTLGECRLRGVPDRLIADVTAIIAEAGLDITRGATMELDLSGVLHGDTETYLEVVRLKTAALLRAACRTGAVLADGTAEQTDALSDFGEALGIAFQIHDDLLPYTQPLAAAGKPRTSDLRNGRPVLPLLLAHLHGSDAERALLAGLLAEETDEELRQERLHQLLEETGALKAAEHTANDHLDRCHSALELLPPSRHRRRLATLADQYKTPETSR